MTTPRAHAGLVAALLISSSALAVAQDPRVDSTRPSPRADTIPRQPIRVCAGGDVTLGTNLDSKWPVMAERRLRAVYGLSARPGALVAPLRPLFADADVVLVNVEMAIGSGSFTPKCGPRSKNCFMFRADPDAATAIRSLGGANAAVVGNVANNHARDAGDDRVDTTVALLGRAGVLASGNDTMATPVRLPDGRTIGVLGFHTSTQTPDVRDLAAVRRYVERAVATYGTVIVTAHMGAEGAGAQRTRDSTELFLDSKIDRGNPVAFANAALDAGATLVIGHGPHVVRGAEWRGDRLVLYSIGNLLTYGPFNLGEPMNRGVVACADVLDRRVTDAELRPTMQIAPGVVVPDATRRSLVLIDSLGALDFPRTAAPVGVWGELRRPVAAPRP